ncbi:unknown [Bacteroides sp. CAG:462]|nr:unknown [Bacteroides sp. CAG:462]
MLQIESLEHIADELLGVLIIFGVFVVSLEQAVAEALGQRDGEHVHSIACEQRVAMYHVDGGIGLFLDRSLVDVVILGRIQVGVVAFIRFKHPCQLMDRQLLCCQRIAEVRRVVQVELHGACFRVFRVCEQALVGELEVFGAIELRQEVRFKHGVRIRVRELAQVGCGCAGEYAVYRKRCYVHGVVSLCADGEVAIGHYFHTQV